MPRAPSVKSLVFLCMLVGTPALAQDDPELGVVSEAAERPAAETSGSESSRFDPEWERPKSNEEGEKKGDSDHEAVIGSIGIGLLGMAEVPVGVGDPIGGGGPRRTTSSPISAPVLGVRYWFNERMGFEAGVGFSFSGGTIKTTNLDDADNATTRAYAFHGGLPISLAFGKHYNLLTVPYFGFAMSSATDTRGTSGSADDIFGKGTLVEGGLKLGVEAQLGAIGLEGLALQLSAGVRVRYESTIADVPVINNMGAATSAVDIETSNAIFSTSPGSTLGSAIAGTIAAIYYF